MKLLVVLMLCAVAAAAPKLGAKEKIQLDFPMDLTNDDTPESRNFVVNALVRQLINIIRGVINNGSGLLGIPPLDPIDIKHLHLKIPAGLINLDLELEDVFGSGFGGFVVHRSNVNLREISLDLDISVPKIDINADKYDLIGDILTAIPIYGKGNANFIVENFSLQAKLFLTQSEDGKSVIIDRVENATFNIPSFKSKLTGAIGGGDIDGIVNAIVEEVIIDYVNRFQGAIATVGGHAVVHILNPVLEQFDTWRLIAPFV